MRKKENNYYGKVYRNKKIEAEPMTRGAYNEFKGWKIPEDENPNDEGYIVKYSDDYISWSPKSAFEEAYSKIGDKPLVDTALLMKSSDYKERFIAEYQQLTIRYNALKKMLAKWDKNELNFTPVCSRDIYDLQMQAMSDYKAVLKTRATLESINLPEVNGD